MLDLLDLFKEYQSYTTTQKLIADYIIINTHACSYMTLKTFAQNVGVAEITVLKFCSRVGLNGYSDLKKILRNFCTSTSSKCGGTSKPEEMLRSMYSEEIHNIVETYSKLDTQQMLNFASDIIDADEVFIFAHNASYFLAEHLAHKLNILQIKATPVKVNDTESLGAVLTNISTKNKQLAVFYSFPHYYLPMTEIKNYCIEKGLKTVIIASGFESPLLDENSRIFFVESKSSRFVNSYAAALSLDNIISFSISIVLGSEYSKVRDEEVKVQQFIKNVYEK